MKKKQFFNMLLSLCVAATLINAGIAPVQAASVGETFTALNSDSLEITYKVTSALTVEVSASSTSTYSGIVDIPSDVSDGTDTYSVTSIGIEAFKDCTGLTGVTIPDGVTSIGNNAFQGCTGLISVDIPDSVTSIGNNAFYGCTGLTGVTIPESVTSIGEYAFSYCNALTSVEIPDGVTSISSCTFLGSIGLTSVRIPESVTSIGDSAFHTCTGLTSITIPDSVTSIGNQSFLACTGLTNVTIPDSVTTIGSYTFKNCTGLSSVTIPYSVTSIGYGAFYGCTGLTGITIPHSVTSIDQFAFYGCTGLLDVTLPINITSIGYRAFYECGSLASVYFDGPQPTIGSDAFNIGTASLYYNNSYVYTTGSAYTFTSRSTNTVAVTPTSGGTVTPSTVNGMDGETISLHITPDLNYYLISLAYNDGTDHPITANSFTMPDAPVTVNALFETRTVTFNNNGGSGVSPESANTVNGGFVELPTTNPVLTGYAFSGWNTAPDGNGTSFTSATPVTGDITVYAVWTINVYNITYHLDAGVNSGSNPNTYTYGTEVVLNTPSKPGYSFGGWYTDPTFSFGTMVTSISDSLTGDIDLYALWTANTPPENSSSTTYYAIVATAGTGGSISPIGNTSITYGNDKTYTITADEGYEIEDVLVDGISIGNIPTYTFKNVKKAHTITVSFRETKVEIINPFTDISTDDWYYNNIMYVFENRLMNGTNPDTFSPDNTMTRAMLITVLYRLSGDSGSYNNSFSDVPSNTWYENAIAWAAANGIASGVGNNRFEPETNISREQLAVILYNYAKYKGMDISVGNDTNILSYNDAASISDYAHSALQWACGANIIIGDGNGNLNPQSSSTRAEVAAIIQRFIENPCSYPSSFI